MKASHTVQSVGWAASLSSKHVKCHLRWSGPLPKAGTGHDTCKSYLQAGSYLITILSEISFVISINKTFYELLQQRFDLSVLVSILVALYSTLRCVYSLVLLAHTALWQIPALRRMFNQYLSNLSLSRNTFLQVYHYVWVSILSPFALGG